MSVGVGVRVALSLIEEGLQLVALGRELVLHLPQLVGPHRVRRHRSLVRQPRRLRDLRLIRLRRRSPPCDLLLLGSLFGGDLGGARLPLSNHPSPFRLLLSRWLPL